MRDNKKAITILTLFTIIFTVLGGSLAYWNWNSQTNTSLAFTIAKDFSCSADGGEPINTESVMLAPTELKDDEDGVCIFNEDRVIKRTIKVTPTITKSGLSINMNMWLYVNNIAEELSDSENLRYLLTTNENSCETGIVSEGSFNGTRTGSKLNLFNNKQYSYGFNGPDTYYLWIWLDAAEENNNTMNKGFDVSLGGECTDSPSVEAEEPVMDDGMIPVTIANDGTVKTVDSKDSSWYDYENKQWANVVLVNENATDGVEGSHSRSYYQENLFNNEIVAPEDILAYYVWIPRYRYKITECGDITNPVNEETYPECYGYPYILSEEDINTITSDYKEWLITEEECSWSDSDNGWICGKGDNKYLMTEEDFERDCESIPYGSACGWLDLDDYIRNLNHNVTYEKSFLENEEVIEIEFENGTNAISNGDAINSYWTHPAFWWNNDNDENIDSSEMLPGIWVGKFETTGNSSKPTILPETLPLTGQKISAQFNTALNFAKSSNIYGLSDAKTNSHMMKNSEWAAVAYLTDSKYGVGEVDINLTYYTGYLECVDYPDDCYNAYGEDSSYPQSTTGNITGIFDMVGGVHEHVMGNYNKTVGSSGISQSILELNGSYIDIYSDQNVKGHALYETAGWYNDSSSFAISGYPWILRGGDSSSGEKAGIFAFYQAGGGANTKRGFRMTIVNGIPSYNG